MTITEFPIKVCIAQIGIDRETSDGRDGVETATITGA